MFRHLKVLFTFTLLALVLGSCRIEMGVGAKLNSDGSGTFTLALALDKEFIEGLATGNKAAQDLGGIKGFEEFFGELRTAGWKVTRNDLSGGVAFRGACDFKNQAGFGACIGQLGSKDSDAQGLSFKDAGLAFDLGSRRGFFKTHTYFAGRVNLEGPLSDRSDQFRAQLRSLSSQVFTFEVRAELPGSVRIVQGAGGVDGNTAFWSPKLGEILELRAESDAYNPVAIFAVGFPVILSLLVGVFMVVRKRPSTPDEGGFAVPTDAAVTDGFETPPQGEPVEAVTPDPS